MRKLTTLLVLLLFAGLQVAFAQRTITGRVTKTTDNTALAGVTVLVKGTTTGMTTDTDGRYSIAVPNNEAILQFSFIGLNPKEVAVGAQTIIDVALEEAMRQMDEVVVTALGIKRESKSLGYSATSVKTEELLTHKSTNMMESLEGKVAGLNITLPASGVGGSSQIRLRGQAAFDGANNSPLIVINGLPIDQGARGANGGNQRDLGDNMSNVNPDDIETMTVLKGATAAAIYGSRAANGAIIITTKTGQKNQAIGVEYSTSFTAQKPMSFFKFQDVYGQGTAGNKPTTASLAASTGQLSWGGRLDGSDITIFDGTTVPYSFQPNRVLDYFHVGKVSTNTVAFSGGGANGSFRASISTTNGSGIEPSNEYKKKSFNIGVTHDITKRLKFTTNINYIKEDYINPPQIGQQGAGSMNFLTRLAMNIPLVNLRYNNTNVTNGTEAVTSGFQGTILNPYYARSAGASYINTRDRFLGTSTLRWDITDWLYAQGRFNYDYSINFNETKAPAGVATSVPTNSDGTYKGTYRVEEGWGTDVNSDFLIGASKKFNKFTVDASFGGNTFRVKNHNFVETATNLTVRDLFSIANGVTKTPTFGFNQTRVNSLYGLAEFGYNSMLYLNFTGRTDWFSVLNPSYNSKFYPSVSGSFVFSELLKDQKWLTYGKLRGSWAQVGSSNGVNAYDGLLTYSLGTNQFNGQTTASIAGGGAAPNLLLQPFTVTEKEVGLEARLFNNKVHFDFGYFDKLTTDQIMSVQLSDASGYTSSKQNLGSLKNSGVEFLLEYTPIETKDFSWTTSWNTTYLKTEVLSVGKSPDGTPIKDFLVLNFNTTGNEFLGELHYTVGMAMNQLYTRTYQRNDQGQVIVQSNGRLLATPSSIPVGSSIPKHTGGWNNTFTYKNLSLGVFIDYKLGGTVLSSTLLNMTRQGMSPLSLEGRRIYADGTVEAGLVFPGVYDANPDPNITDWQPNTTPVTIIDLANFYADYRNLQIGDPFTFKSDFVKLRSITLSYNLNNVLKNVSFLSFIKGLTLQASCRNVAILYKDLPNLDPEAIQSSGDTRAGYENSSLLTTRDFMFSLNVKF
jgi:TonB-linked SusC/RagA family outer membrane protein